MKLSATRLFPLLLMLALALLSFWLERAARKEPVAAAQPRHDPDYSVEQFIVTDFSPAGALISTLSAAKMVHYPDDDSTVLLAPRLVQSKPEQPRLLLNADRGALSRDAEELFLNDNVVLLREPGADSGESRMQTSFLHVVRARSLVRTDREVTITERGRSLVGLGMEYDNESRQLSLHAQVHGSFEAEK
ncbi:MAG: LPS export ABC transporter periplasmic protein LptC [Betaproteobacteria bacterium]|nr:LPS export ABC transporter periplasmic protein LptC [Betaproteobacteria bacterium]